MLPKKYNNLTDDCDKNTKEKAQRSVSSNENLNLKIIKNFLEAEKLEKEINPLEKDDIEKIV